MKQTLIVKAIAVGAALAFFQLSASAQSASAKPASLFPDAKPGECYAKVYIAPQYTTDTQRVVKREAGKRIEVIPAKFGMETEEVVVREASTRLEVVPAVYATETEEIIVSSAYKRIEVVSPAMYEDRTEQVLAQAATTTWKSGRSKAVQIASAKVLRESTSSDGEIMCLVEIPARYNTVTTRVLKTPPQTREIEVPAVTRTVTRTVVKSPPTTREVEIPAVTKTVQVRREVEPARTVDSDIPAEYQSVLTTRKVADGRYEWRSILCETNSTPQKIRQIQQALADKGFVPGPIDGVLSSLTMGAVNRFQISNKLPVDPYLNLQTVQALGVDSR